MEPFRPRFARRIAWAMIAVIVAFLVGLLIASVTVLDGWGPVDWALAIAFFGTGAWFVHRQATVSAIPDESGLTVRNLIETRHVAWEEIVRISFAHGRPWVGLDLADGDTMAVMAIQGADGEYGRAEARRLAGLVAEHEAPEH